MKRIKTWKRYVFAPKGKPDLEDSYYKHGKYDDEIAIRIMRESDYMKMKSAYNAANDELIQARAEIERLKDLCAFYISIAAKPESLHSVVALWLGNRLHRLGARLRVVLLN